MARVLLAWEFGGDLGHMMRVLAIAHELRDRGHEPLLAFADLGALGTLDSGGIPAVPAPLLAPPRTPDRSPLNASDILLNLGFADTAGLAGALCGWSGLLRLFAPKLLVADYAPTALLAARAAGIPRATVGSGFSDPPRGEPMPALRNWIASDPTVLAQRDARLVESVREALSRSHPRSSPPTSAAALFEADAHLVCSWPEVDPFGPRDGVEYLGPQGEGSPPVEVAWLSLARPRIFAYLKPRDPRFEAVLQAISAAGGEAIVAAPGLEAPRASALSTGGMRVVPAPVSLEALAGADLCVCHAGAGVAAAALAHGVAQALLPGHLEQYLIARRLTAAGAAHMLDPEAGAEEVAPFIAGALADEGLRSAAATLVLKRPAGRASARIAQMLEA